MKEIGGYFGLEHLMHKPYYKNLIELNTGRNALLYLMKAKKIKKLYIPYFLCKSVRNMLEKYKYDYELYKINDKFSPIFDKCLRDDEYLYIVNYYGQLNNESVDILRQNYKNIILDNTQAFFQNPIDGIDTIYSCRKFFGVPDGAYLSTESILGEELDVDVSKDRMEHILGRYEGQASNYYNRFKDVDLSFTYEPLKYMSKITRNILGAIDYENVKKMRNENFAYLYSKIKKHNKIKLKEPDGAFAYPFYIRNGFEVRKKLAENKIYIPILWPNVLIDTPNVSIEYDYAANILPLPCDQRYGIEDMDNILEELKYCMMN